MIKIACCFNEANELVADILLTEEQPPDAIHLKFVNVQFYFIRSSKMEIDKEGDITYTYREDSLSIGASETSIVKYIEMNAYYGPREKS